MNIQQFGQTDQMIELCCEPVSSKEFLHIQATIEFRFTLKCIGDMIITYSQMHCTGKYSQHRIIWPVWPNGWVFVYELSDCEFESRCCHLSFSFMELWISILIGVMNALFLSNDCGETSN